MALPGAEPGLTESQVTPAARHASSVRPGGSADKTIRKAPPHGWGGRERLGAQRCCGDQRITARRGAASDQAAPLTRSPAAPERGQAWGGRELVGVPAAMATAPPSMRFRAPRAAAGGAPRVGRVLCWVREAERDWTAPARSPEADCSPGGRPCIAGMAGDSWPCALSFPK